MPLWREQPHLYLAKNKIQESATSTDPRNLNGALVDEKFRRSNTSEFYVDVTVHRNKFLYNKTNRCINFPNLFWLKNEPLHVSGGSSAHHQEFTNCTLGIGICHTV